MVTTDPDAIVKVLKPYLSKLRRAGHEAGSLSPWLQVELKQRCVPAICLEAWHARAALSAMRNKTDKADARGIAHIMRAGGLASALPAPRDRGCRESAAF